MCFVLLTFLYNYTLSSLPEPSVPSSNRGCKAFSGRYGDASARPTSSSTTTDTKEVGSLLS